MDSDKVKQLSRAIESKLLEILPNLDQLIQEYGVLEPIEVKFKIDLSKLQSAASQSENIQARPPAITERGCVWIPEKGWSCTQEPALGDC
jgi:hypothetical protein